MKKYERNLLLFHSIVTTGKCWGVKALPFRGSPVSLLISNVKGFRVLGLLCRAWGSLVFEVWAFGSGFRVKDFGRCSSFRVWVWVLDLGSTFARLRF